MQLFHQTCRGRWRRPVRKAQLLFTMFVCRRGRLRQWVGDRITFRRMARIRLAGQSVDIATRTYRCNECDLQMHVDMDWSEGALPEPEAVLD